MDFFFQIQGIFNCLRDLRQPFFQVFLVNVRFEEKKRASTLFEMAYTQPLNLSMLLFQRLQSQLVSSLRCSFGNGAEKTMCEDLGLDGYTPFQTKRACKNQSSITRLETMLANLSKCHSSSFKHRTKRRDEY